MFEDGNAVCPYFRHADKRIIKCEGLTKGSNVSQVFNHTGKVEKYRYDFCDCMCYKGCPIAIMLTEKNKD